MPLRLTIGLLIAFLVLVILAIYLVEVGAKASDLIVALNEQYSPPQLTQCTHSPPHLSTLLIAA